MECVHWDKMPTGHFSKEALDAVAALYAEGQPNPYEGECGQKKLREQNRTQRTPLQEQADQARSQALRGRDNMGAGRSAAAKKGAETRKKCAGLPANPTQG